MRSLDTGGSVLRPRPVPGAGTFGLALFLASLAVFFATAFIGYLVVRLRAGAAWPPAGAPGLPAGMWWSTGLILAGSLAIQTALRAARRGRQRALSAAMVAAGLLGVAFLVTQAFNWNALLAADLTARSNLFGFTFYVLTGLHAVHIVGGLIPMAVVTVNAFRGRYSWAHYPGVKYCAIYWHFLGVIWLVMFGALYIAG